MLLAGVLILFGFGQALGARGHAQRAADLAAVSAAQVMGRNLTRLYEPRPGRRPCQSATSVERRVPVAGEERGAARRPRQRRGAREGAGALPARQPRAHARDRGHRRTGRGQRSPAGDASGFPFVPALPPRSPSTQRASAWPRRPAAAATPARSRTGRASRCGPTSPPRSTGWRRPPSGGQSRAARDLRLPLRRRAGPPLRRPSGPEVGRAARHSLHRYGTELDLGPPSAYGWLAANAPGSASQAGTRGSPGISATR